MDPLVLGKEQKTRKYGQKVSKRGSCNVTEDYQVKYKDTKDLKATVAVRVPLTHKSHTIVSTMTLEALTIHPGVSLMAIVPIRSQTTTKDTENTMINTSSLIMLKV